MDNILTSGYTYRFPLLLLGLLVGLLGRTYASMVPVVPPQSHALVSSLESSLEMEDLPFDVNSFASNPFDNKPFMSREYVVEGPGMLKAFTFSGDIEVTTVKDTEKVKIELYLDRGYSFWSNSKNLENYRITMKKVGRHIISSVERKVKKGFFSDRMKFSYKIYLPEKMSTELKTSAGNVRVSGLTGNQSVKSHAGDIDIDHIKGRVQAFTSGGDVDISNTEGTIFVQANGGDVQLDNSRGEIRLKLNGGSILAEHISGTIASQVDGGDIKVHFAHIAKGADLSTTAGDISIDVPDKMGVTLNFRGTNINLPKSWNINGIKRDDLIRGDLHGGGVPLNLSTDYGTITVKVNRRR